MSKKLSVCVELTVDDDADEADVKEFMEHALPQMGLEGETSPIQAVDNVYEVIEFTRR